MSEKEGRETESRVLNKKTARLLGVDEISYGFRPDSRLLDLVSSRRAVYLNLRLQTLLDMCTVVEKGRRILCVDCALFVVMYEMRQDPYAHGLSFPLFNRDGASEEQRKLIGILKETIKPYRGRSIETWYHTCICVSRKEPPAPGQHKHQWVARYGNQKNMYIGIIGNNDIVVEHLAWWMDRQGGNVNISGV